MKLCNHKIKGIVEIREMRGYLQHVVDNDFGFGEDGDFNHKC